MGWRSGWDDEHQMFVKYAFPHHAEYNDYERLKNNPLFHGYCSEASRQAAGPGGLAMLPAAHVRAWCLMPLLQEACPIRWCITVIQ